MLISVTNLASNVSEKDIWEVFGPFGAVSNVDLRPSNDQSQDASGMATVTMPVYQDAVCAIMAIDQTEVGIQILNKQIIIEGPKCSKIFLMLRFSAFKPYYFILVRTENFEP